MKTRSMKTKSELQHSLQWLELDLKKANTEDEIETIEKKIKDIRAKIAKKGGSKRHRSTRRR